MRALVVFQHGNRHWWSRWLKRGFGHCVAIIEANGYWLLIDDRGGRLDFTLLADIDRDLAGFFRAKGYTVIETEQNPPGVRFPLIAASCTGLVKAALNLRGCAVTPHQLYRRLRNGRRT